METIFFQLWGCNMRAIEILEFLRDEDNSTDFTISYIQKAIDEIEKEIPKYKTVSFDVWWSSTGSGYVPQVNNSEIPSIEDCEEFTMRVAKKAWDYAMFLRKEALK